MHRYNVITEYGDRYALDAGTLKEAVEAFYADPCYRCARTHDLVSVVQVGNGWIA